MPLNFTDRPLVYLAAPYTVPEPVENLHQVIQMADELQATGLVTCLVPHTSMTWHLVAPKSVAHWYAHDLALLARCDALLRLPGLSAGADDEVRFAEDRDIKVFRHVDDLLDWAGGES